MILALWIAVRMTAIGLEPEPATDISPTRPGIVAAAAPVAAVTAAAPNAVPRETPPEPFRHEASLASLALPYAQRRGGAHAARFWPAAVAGGFCGPVAATSEERTIQEGGSEAPAALAPAPMPTAMGVERGPLLAFLGAAFGARPSEAPRAPALPGRREIRAARLSADGWVLARGGSSAPSLASGASAYGGSQAGAVLRYALAPRSPLAPKAYLRVSGALGGRVQESESALGLMLRPLQRVPLAVMGEVRLQQGTGSPRVRPVFMAVSELPPLRLPFRAEGELYAQGGWAGGQDATAFYDLAATVQRPFGAPFKGIRLRAGGGMWSGGQRGAARLDVGPRIELRSMIGPPSRRIGVRVGIDWRFRVAGGAEPGSGPALTVAAGF